MTMAKGRAKVYVSSLVELTFEDTNFLRNVLEDRSICQGYRAYCIGSS